MTNATITKTKTRKARTQPNVLTEPANKAGTVTTTKAKPKTKKYGSNAPCENCSAKTKKEKVEEKKKKKKPMFKLGSWRGAFKGTLDF